MNSIPNTLSVYQRLAYKQEHALFPYPLPVMAVYIQLLTHLVLHTIHVVFLSTGNMRVIKR